MSQKPPPNKKPRCAICREPIDVEDNPQFPFCSKKCRMIDLGRWFDEDYSLPAPVTERDLSELERAMANKERSED